MAIDFIAGYSQRKRQDVVGIVVIIWAGFRLSSKLGASSGSQPSRSGASPARRRGPAVVRIICIRRHPRLNSEMATHPNRCRATT